jgi:hypothetical protein
MLLLLLNPIWQLNQVTGSRHLIKSARRQVCKHALSAFASPPWIITGKRVFVVARG